MSATKLAEVMTLPRFDNVLNMGNLIQMALIVGAVLLAWSDARKDIDALQDAQKAAAVTLAQKEARVRALEISDASKSADLRNILTILTRIERQLEAR
jgi:hypothetical protein